MPCGCAAGKTEIAVLISLGISKENILSQMVLEEMILYIIAFAGAGIAAKLLLPRISNSLAIMQGNSITLELLIWLAVRSFMYRIDWCCNIDWNCHFPYMKKPVKETLSEMEG